MAKQFPYAILNGHEVKPVTSATKWAVWFEHADRTVGLTKLGDCEISTVFVGLHDNLFETIVFGGPLDGQEARYDTWEEAQAGHMAMVARVAKAEGKESKNARGTT